MQTKSSSLKTIFFIVLFDLLGVGIIIPVFAALFLKGNFLPAEMSFQSRTILLGVLSVMYPLAQFFGSPILGAFSDKYGRKPVLLVSLLGTFVGYILFAAGIFFKSIPLLFISRLLDGFTAGNISVANSAIADMSDPKTRAKNFGLIGMAFGIGFVIGPFLGGVLSDPSILPWFNFSTPFLFAALLSCLNIVFVLRSFAETLKVKNSKLHIHPLTGFVNIKKAFALPHLRILFTVMFFTVFGFSFFTQFFQVFLIERFAYTQSDIGYLFAFMGVCIALVQGGLVRTLVKYFHPPQILRVSLLGLAITLPFLVLQHQSFHIYFIIPFISIFNGLTMPNTSALVSQSADASSQGEIMGISESLRSLAMMLPPLIAGFIVAIHVSIPTLVASVSIFISWVLFVIFYKDKTKDSFHEV